MISNIFVPARNAGNKNFAGAKQLVNTVSLAKNVTFTSHEKGKEYLQYPYVNYFTSQFKSSKADLRNIIPFKGGFTDFIVQAKLDGKSCITISPNPMGEGKFAKIYNINGLDDYLIKVIKTEKNQQPPLQFEIDKFTPVRDELEGRNFGQPIEKFIDNEGIYVIIRQSGKEHSIKDWLSYLYEQPGYDLTNEHAQKFNKDVDQLAQLPIESYVNFAESLKFLSDKGYKTDCLNPGNCLIDHNRTYAVEIKSGKNVII